MRHGVAGTHHVDKLFQIDLAVVLDAGQGRKDVQVVVGFGGGVAVAQQSLFQLRQVDVAVAGRVKDVEDAAEVVELGGLEDVALDRHGVGGALVHATVLHPPDRVEGQGSRLLTLAAEAGGGVDCFHGGGGLSGGVFWKSPSNTLSRVHEAYY